MISGTLFEVPLDQTLPYALRRDRRIVALAGAIAEQLAINARMIQETDGFYYRIDQLSERVLDMLAHDLHVDWYDYEAGLEEKRSIIASSVFVHRHMGTPSAIYRVIRDVFEEGSLEEWFQYNGQPNRFRVRTEQAERVNQNIDKFLEMIGKAKPVSQMLEHVTVCRSGLSTARMGIASKAHYSIEATMETSTIIGDWFMDELEQMLTDEHGDILV